ncbi:MAG: phospholipase D-like domain-containing protein [Rickettsiales bacterium]|jgi:phosphatidylserine/phosphatidylglycerophosphate/cardiolipin synthase-like enzyme|nr:phospholipase D-like domain-containing protein [Rickettsiales bacterium]
MKKYIIIISLFLCSAKSFNEVVKEVYFAPGNDCADLVIRQLDKAKISIDIAMFEITDKQIINKIKEVSKNGVKTKIILDGFFKDTVFDELENVRVKFDMKDEYEYSEFMIVDDTQVVTGGYNWSESEKNNSANCLLIEDKDKIYKNRFLYLWHDYYDALGLDFCIDIFYKVRKENFNTDKIIDLYGISPSYIVDTCYENLEYHNIDEDSI